MNNGREIERDILLRSHSKDDTERLLTDRYSLGGEQKPIINLNNTNIPPKPIKQQAPDLFKNQRRIARHALNNYIKESRKASKLASNLEKRGISNINNNNIDKALKNVPKYDSFLKLNQLWNNYIDDLMKHNHGTPVTGKLASGDYHGADLTVTQSRNPTMVGINGICIWESKSAFIVCTKKNDLKILQKEGSKFKINAESLNHHHQTFEIIGSRFSFRTAERSGRKFKPKAVDDL